MIEYSIPVLPCRAELEVKKSRFIAIVQHVSHPDQTKEALLKVKAEFPDAGHHCYGFVAGAPYDTQCYGFSDDGEPSGTAGMPILKRLRHSGLGEIQIVVVRYFGGTKLGTGGLVRAYGDTTNMALAQLETTLHIPMKDFRVEIPFSREAEIRKRIIQSGGSIENALYQSQVILTGKIPATTKTDLASEYPTSS